MNYNAALGCLLIAVAILCSGCTSGDGNKEYINKGGSKTVVCV